MQIEDNLKALAFLDELTPEVMAKIDNIFPKPQSVKTYFT